MANEDKPSDPFRNIHWLDELVHDSCDFKASTAIRGIHQSQFQLIRDGKFHVTLSHTLPKLRWIASTTSH